MSLSIEKRDRNSPLEDHLSGTLATAPLRLSFKLSNGSTVPPIELGPDDELVLLVEELGGARVRNDQELAAAQGDVAATMDQFRSTNRVRLHLTGLLAAADGHSHGLADNEVPEAPARMHAMLHPEGLHEL